MSQDWTAASVHAQPQVVADTLNDLLRSAQEDGRKISKLKCDLECALKREVELKAEADGNI